jgi:hypothetical protein
MKRTLILLTALLLAVTVSATAASVPDHPLFKKVAVAIGPIEPIEEGQELLYQKVRETFAEVYQNNNPPINVGRVVGGQVRSKDPRAVAMFLAKAQPFQVLMEAPNGTGFIAVAPLSDFAATGIVFVWNPGTETITILLVDLTVGPPSGARS